MIRSVDNGKTTGPVIGVVGGGQLARMMCEAASELALDVRVLASAADESAPSTWRATTVVETLDAAALAEFAAGCDVLTFDHELIAPDVLEALESAGHVLRPSAAALAFSDKAVQRTRLAAAGVPVPRFDVVDSVADVERFAASTGGWPLVVKPPRGGYDGRGVYIVQSVDDVLDIVRATGGPVVVEELVRIDTEVAVIVVTGPDGTTVTYPAVETRQVDGICHDVVCPAGIDATVSVEAARVAERVASIVGAVGVLAVEMFVADGRVLVNEVAPRPHNSGHLTIEACTVSQFENHLRAVAGLPLGPSSLLSSAAMVNIIGTADAGDPAARRHHVLAVPGAHLHLYGKSWRPGRKLGHITVVGPDTGSALATARDALNRLDSDRDATMSS
jgi:5-(carboxyamino)imidazole ribonucleotide synthase